MPFTSEVVFPKSDEVRFSLHKQENHEVHLVQSFYFKNVLVFQLESWSKDIGENKLLPIRAKITDYHDGCTRDLQLFDKLEPPRDFDVASSAGTSVSSKSVSVSGARTTASAATNVSMDS